MRALLKRNANSAVVASVFFAINAIAWDADQPDDPAAHDAAKLSLLSLGPDQGAQSLIEDLSSDILFDFDKADIKPTAETELTKLGLIIREKRTGDVTIIGHTDAKGSDNYNMGLSDRRADSVKNWLVKYAQINAEVITTEGLGETPPIAPNVKADGSDDIDGRTKNRRVDVTIQTKEALN